MRNYYLFILIAVLIVPTYVTSAPRFWYQNNSYYYMPGSDPVYQPTPFRASPSTTTTRRLLRSAFNLTPGGALRSSVLTLMSLEAADYVWDEVEEWWKKEIQPAYDPPPGSTCQLYFQGSSATRDGNLYGDVSSACSEIGGTMVYLDSLRDTCSIAPFTIVKDSITGATGVAAGIGELVTDSALASCNASPLMNSRDAIRAPLPDLTFSDIIGSKAPEDVGVPLLNNLPQSEVDRIIGTSPDSGTSRQLPEQAISSTSSREPVTVSTVDPDTGTVMSKTDWPAFCDWAGIVCEFIDWMTEPLSDDDGQEIPTEEVGDLQTYDSGLGGGSCPAGVNFTVQGNAVHYSFQPACDAMTWFRPILLGMCTLIAGFILVGHKQGQKMINLVYGLLSLWASGLIAALLIGGGFTLLIGAALNTVITNLLNTASSYMAGTASSVFDLIMLGGVGEALSIIGGAMITRAMITTAGRVLGVALQQ